jgi:hypothetical protein
MFWKIIKWGFISSVLILVILFAIYLWRPQLLYSGFTAITSTIFKTEPYPTKNGVHPFLEKKIALVIRDARAQGIDLRVVQGFRTMATQQKYYKKGRSTKGSIITNAPPGYSYHNYGLAVDVCEYRNGKPYWKSNRWQEIGTIGKSHGLIWGGDWTRLVDKPHFQLSTSSIIAHVIF